MVAPFNSTKGLKMDFDRQLDKEIDAHTAPDPTTRGDCVHCEKETESTDALDHCGECERPYYHTKDELIIEYEDEIQMLGKEVRALTEELLGVVIVGKHLNRQNLEFREELKKLRGNSDE